MPKKLNGWMEQARKIAHFSNPPKMPAGKTKWEMHLYRIGITEKQAIENPRSVAEWVRKNAGNAFIPEPVLKELGIEPISYWWGA